jgi:hypothetical protein
MNALNHSSAQIWVLVILVVGAIACASKPQPRADDQAAKTNAEKVDGPTNSQTSQPPTRSEVDPESPPAGFETMQVFRVVPTGEGAAVLLVDADGRIVVPIFVGRTIAMTIQLRLQRRRYTRPLTHDLLDEMVDKLDGEVIKVHIDDVKSGVFVGTVYLRDASGEQMSFDSRSSDAIAVAIGHGVPIFVSRAVIEKAGVDTEEFEGGEVPEEDMPEPPDTQPL